MHIWAVCHYHARSSDIICISYPDLSETIITQLNRCSKIKCSVDKLLLLFCCCYYACLIILLSSSQLVSSHLKYFILLMLLSTSTLKLYLSGLRHLPCGYYQMFSRRWYFFWTIQDGLSQSSPRNTTSVKKIFLNYRPVTHIGYTFLYPNSLNDLCYFKSVLLDLHFSYNKLLNSFQSAHNEQLIVNLSPFIVTYYMAV